MKGVGATYDWTFFEYHRVEGVVHNVKDTIRHDEDTDSAQVAKNLSIEVGDDVNVFFVKATPVKLKHKVTGIFKTGLQEFDEQVVIGDMRNVQKLNDWGIQTASRVADTVTSDGRVVIYGDVRGGNGY